MHTVKNMYKVKHWLNSKTWKQMEKNYEDLYNSQNPVYKQMTTGVPLMPPYEEELDILWGGKGTAAIKKLTDDKTLACMTSLLRSYKATGEVGVDVIHRLCNTI